jgi:hypothetical protein
LQKIEQAAGRGWPGDRFFNEFELCNYATRLGQLHADLLGYGRDESEQMGVIDTVKHRTNLGQADQSADPLSSVSRVNIARSHVHSVSHSVLYAASVFFLLQSMSALGMIDRFIYGEWAGKGGDKITQTLNLLSIFGSLFLFWSGTRKVRIARFNRVLPLAAASLPE